MPGSRKGDQSISEQDTNETILEASLVYINAVSLNIPCVIEEDMMTPSRCLSSRGARWPLETAESRRFASQLVGKITGKENMRVIRTISPTSRSFANPSLAHALIGGEPQWIKDVNCFIAAALTSAGACHSRALSAGRRLAFMLYSVLDEAPVSA